MHTQATAPAIQPFSLASLPAGTGPGALRRAALHLAAPLLERAFALTRLNRLYAELAARSAQDTRPFEERALEALGVAWESDPADLARIPPDGPLLVVANHPFGGIDGLLLLALLRRARTDVRLLGNQYLHAIPDLRDRLLYVDPFGGADAAHRNAAALRPALRWVRGGGALAIFPAGEVSHARVGSARVADGPWHHALGRLAALSGAPALAVHFEGRNGNLFQIAGLLHPRLRTALLPREMLRPRRVTVRIGQTIPAQRLERMSGPAEVTSYLRARTHLLRGRAASPGGSAPPENSRAPGRSPNLFLRALSGGLPGDRDRPARAAPAVAEAVATDLLTKDVDALPHDAELTRLGALRVLHARAPQIPHLLQEIGRLRETAFRAVGEGTGRPLDLDVYDGHYVHLFIWNDDAREVVGAYRMGPTDEILPRLGVAGLYTSTLFRYRRELLQQIGPALEMGRSFVRPEYQRHPASLALLWKGIGRYVVAHPRYRCLFGPVSISSDYQSMSRSLLLSFLRIHRHMGALARLIRPRHRRRVAALENEDARLAGATVKDLDHVDELVREIEDDRRAMPVLLRQYLKLNGVLLGFTVDPDFGDVLDGLILVDLARVERHILGRYMGQEGMASFLASHAAGS